MKLPDGMSQVSHSAAFFLGPAMMTYLIMTSGPQKKPYEYLIPREDEKPASKPARESLSRSRAKERMKELEDLPTAEQSIQQILNVAAEQGSSLQVIQVGACDGDWEETHDPIRIFLESPNVQAVVLEPVPALHSELIHRLAKLPQAHERIVALNAAICPGSGVEPMSLKPFFVVNPEFGESEDKTHFTLNQLGGFNKYLMKKNQVPKEYIQEIMVKCLPPDSLFALEGLPIGPNPAQANALVLDAGSLDGEILESFLKIEGFYPALIIFEHQNVPRKKLKTVLMRLDLLSYVVWRDRTRTVAVLSEEK